MDGLDDTLQAAAVIANTLEPGGGTTASRLESEDCTASLERRLVLHIGMPKTGSTTIQGLLVSFEQELRDRGVHVLGHRRLSVGRPTSPDRLRKALYRRSFGPPEQAWRSIAKEEPWRSTVEDILRSNARLFVISHEGFIGRPNPRAPAIISEFANACGLSVDIVAYVRPQCQFFESRYSQMVNRGGYLLPFDAFAAASFTLRTIARHPWLDYRRVFAPWRAVFGPRVTVYPLESSRLPDGLAAHFLGLLGAPELAVREVKRLRVNQRIGAKALEVRRLRNLAVRMPGAERRPRNISHLSLSDTPFTGFNTAQARDLMAHFQAGNAAFAREYGIDSDGLLFRDPVDGNLYRPNVARYQDFDGRERRAVREYLLQRTGDGLTFGQSTGAHQARTADAAGLGTRSRRPLSLRAAVLRSLARTPPAQHLQSARIGSFRWRARSLLNPRFLLWWCFDLAWRLERAWWKPSAYRKHFLWLLGSCRRNGGPH